MSPTAKMKKRQDMSEPTTLEESSILPKTKGNKIIIHRGITEDSNGWGTSLNKDFVVLPTTGNCLAGRSTGW